MKDDIYMSTAEAATKWDLSQKQVRNCYHRGNIPDAIKRGKLILIPKDAENPRTRRKITKKGPKEIDPKKNEELTVLIRKRKSESNKKPIEFIDVDFIAMDTFNCVKILYRDIEQINLKVCKSFSSGEPIQISPNKHEVKNDLEALKEIKITLLMVAYSQTLRAIRTAGINALPSDYGELLKTVYHNLFFDMHTLTFREKSMKVFLTDMKATPCEEINDEYIKLLALYATPNTDTHPLDRIAKSFLQFLLVSPFEDYNYAFACIMMNIELIRNDMLPITFDCNDSTRKKLKYALDEYTTKKDDCSNPVYRKMYCLICEKLEHTCYKK